MFRPTVCPAVAAEVPVQKGMCAVARHLAEAGGAAPYLRHPIPRVWTRHVPAAMSTCDNPSCIDIVRVGADLACAPISTHARSRSARAGVQMPQRELRRLSEGAPPQPPPNDVVACPPGAPPPPQGCAATTHAIERPAVGLPRRGASLSTRAKRRTAHQQFRNARQPSQRNAPYGSQKVRMPTLRSPASTACALGAFGCPPRIHHEPDSS